MKNIDVYDFDGTIYKGDSSFDFVIYAIVKKKSLIRYIPKILLYMLLFAVHIVSMERLKEVCFSFVKKIDNLDNFINNFWKEKEKNINNFFLENIKVCNENVVISASPEFLLKPYISKFDNVKLIGTKFDNNWKMIGKNCKREEKVRILKEVEPNINIVNFYSDSDNDLPLAKMARHAFRVTDGKVEKWNIE